MFVKITRSGPRSYVKLVESFRDDQGVPRQRVIATLGRLEAVQAGGAAALIAGLQRVSGSAVPDEPADSTGPVVNFATALSVGDTWLLSALWQRLGLAAGLHRVLRNSRSPVQAEALLRVMVFNRLCQPCSKLGVMRWLEGAHVPGVDRQEVTHQRLLRAMDVLAERRSEVERTLTKVLRPLADEALSVVFYDLTTLRAEGNSEMPQELRAHGLSKEGGIARQVLLGVVQTAEGLPIAHRVWQGNTAESTTLQPALQEVLAQWPVRRMVLVADRGLLSLDNLAQLQHMVLPAGQALEFILAVPGRRYAEFTEVLQPLHEAHCTVATQEVIGETTWQERRLVWAHDCQAAAQQTQRRQDTIDAIITQAQARAGKLDEQQAGERFKGRRLSDSGAKAWLFREVTQARLGAIIKVDLQSEDFSFDIDEHALQRARLNDGKLLLVTNVPDLSAKEVVRRYKSLADIERGFRVLKSDIEIAPLHHRLPERIRAHALICFIALVLHRVMRLWLKVAGSPHSPERALEIVRHIQFHHVTIAGRGHATGVGDITSNQREIFDALKLDLPTKERLIPVL